MYTVLSCSQLPSILGATLALKWSKMPTDYQDKYLNLREEQNKLKKNANELAEELKK